MESIITLLVSGSVQWTISFPSGCRQTGGWLSTLHKDTLTALRGNVAHYVPLPTNFSSCVGNLNIKKSLPSPNYHSVFSTRFPQETGNSLQHPKGSKFDLCCFNIYQLPQLPSPGSGRQLRGFGVCSLFQKKTHKLQ